MYIINVYCRRTLQMYRISGSFRCKFFFVVGTNHENLTHDIFLTMNNYHGQQIVTRARACLIFVDGPDNEN